MISFKHRSETSIRPAGKLSRVLYCNRLRKVKSLQQDTQGSKHSSHKQVFHNGYTLSSSLRNAKPPWFSAGFYAPCMFVPMLSNFSSHRTLIL